MLILRDDLDASEERELLRKFLVPSVTAPASWPGPVTYGPWAQQGGHTGR
jgi:hypothetical protein